MSLVEEPCSDCKDKNSINMYCFRTGYVYCKTCHYNECDMVRCDTLHEIPLHQTHAVDAWLK